LITRTTRGPIVLDTPHTDPAAAAEVAARLRAAADQVDEQARRLDARLDDLTFQGPAALRLRAAMVERCLRATRVADALRELADRARLGEATTTRST
jgi:hypothetical protein